MPYDRENVLTGKRAYQVLKNICRAEDGSYSTKISNKIGTTQQVVSEIIKILKDLGLIQKGKRTQAQYYEINLKGFVALFEELIQEEIIEESSEEELEVLESELDLFDESTNYDIRKALDRDVSVLIQIYSKNYLLTVENSSIKEMLIDDFFLGLERNSNTLDKLNTPEWIYALKALGEKRMDYMEDPKDIFFQSLQAYQEIPDTIEKKNNYLVVPENPLESGIYEVEETESGYKCQKCGEEFEDFELGKESPCGCGEIESQANVFQ